MIKEKPPTKKPKKPLVPPPKKLVRASVVDKKEEHDLSDSPLNLKQELFCQYYTNNKATRGNGTWAYAYAYEYPLAEQSKDDGVYEFDKEGRVIKTIRASSFARMEAICAVGGSVQLRKIKIQRRNIELLNELLRDNIVDARLSEILLMGGYDDAMKAIKEYNQLKGRITEKIEQKTEVSLDLSDADKKRLLALLKLGTK